MLEVTRAADLSRHIGQTVGMSEWVKVDQELIDGFAELTGDRQWIHVDVERARREAPYGSTIAHGYLLLSLLPRFTLSLYSINKRRQTLNYGLDKVRFTTPVPAGSRVRLRLGVSDVVVYDDRVKVVWENVMELEGSERPAVIAESISLVFD